MCIYVCVYVYICIYLLTVVDDVSAALRSRDLALLRLEAEETSGLVTLPASKDIS